MSYRKKYYLMNKSHAMFVEIISKIDNDSHSSSDEDVGDGYI